MRKPGGQESRNEARGSYGIGRREVLKLAVWGLISAVIALVVFFVLVARVWGDVSDDWGLQLGKAGPVWTVPLETAEMVRIEVDSAGVQYVDLPAGTIIQRTTEDAPKRMVVRSHMLAHGFDNRDRMYCAGLEPGYKGVPVTDWRGLIGLRIAVRPAPPRVWPLVDGVLAGDGKVYRLDGDFDRWPVSLREGR